VQAILIYRLIVERRCISVWLESQK